MNNQRRSVLLIFLVLLAAGFLFSLGFANAQTCFAADECTSSVGGSCENIDSDSGLGTCIYSGSSASGDVITITSGSSGAEFFKNFLNLEARWKLWTTGYDKLDSNQQTLLGETLKYLILIMVVIAVYGALSAIEFPQGKFSRMGLAFIVGILGTFMITTNELVTALLSYGALTTTIVLAVPIIILIGFTIMMAYKANAVGLFASKILWAAYSVFLFVKGVVLIMMTNTFYVVGSTVKFVSSNSTDVSSLLLPFLPKAVDGAKMGIDASKIAQMMGNADVTTAYVLVGSALLLFFIFVLNSKWIYAWLKNESEQSAIQAARTNVELSTARDKLQADAMRSAAKT